MVEESPVKQQQIPTDTTCRLCGKSMTVYADPPVDPNNPKEAEWRNRLAKVVAHDACVDRLRAESIAADITRSLVEKSSKWKTLCPPDFQAPLDFTRRGCTPARHDAVMAWKFGPRGLFIHGPNRTCKTRMAWKLMEREHFMNGRSAASITHAEVRLKFTSLAREDASKLQAVLDHLCNVNLLLIDDLGKGYCTEASESALFILIDGRVRYQRPMIITSNQAPEDLLPQFSEGRGPALVARIRESCEGLEF